MKLCGNLASATHRRPLAETPPTPQPTRYQTIHIPLFAPVDPLLHEQQHLVDDHELGQVQRVRLRRVEDALDLGW